MNMNVKVYLYMFVELFNLCGKFWVNVVSDYCLLGEIFYVVEGLLDFIFS